MTSRIRTAALAVVTALGLVAAPIALAAPAAAAPLTNILFFSNDIYTDVAEEDATQIAALEAVTGVVTVFDGGDGSAEAWTTALAGQDALVIPESAEIYNTPVLSVAAADVIGAFLAAGGVALFPTEFQADLLSYLTGVDYATGWVTSDGSGDPWAYSGSDPAFPAELGYSDGTYSVDVSAWGPDQFDNSFPVYYNGDADFFAVAGFPVGDGVIYTLAYDWYPGDEGDDAANREVWNVVQGLLLGLVAPAPAPAPAPELAATGSSVDTNVFLAGAAMLLLAGAALVVTRRKARA